jgi:serine phosphatase RsbU (regulator of sigma subunit)/pSer/pThr/pTyr-binding forkhead associated (FHA) protein
VPILSVLSGPDQGVEFRLEQAIVTIGRGGTADLALTDSSVSRHHALVAWEHGEWGLQDLGSANGTFINGRRISFRVPLVPGDALRVGSVLLSYEDDPASLGPASEAPPVVAPEPELHSQILFRVAPEAAERASENNYTLFGPARRSRVLDSLTRISSMVFDERALLSFIVDQLLEALPQSDRAFVMLWDEENKRFVPVSARTRTGDTGPAATSQTLLTEVRDRKEAVLVSSVLTDRKYSMADSIRALKVTSIVCAPILFQGDIFGVIQVDSSSGAEPFTRSDVALTLALALEVGMALAYARLHAKLVERELVEHDLSLARKIQHHFLPPRVPDVPGWDFAVEYKPALAVGGDLYDFVELGGGLLAVAVGDVSGKGVSAALFAAKVMSDLRYQAAGQTSACAILRRLNVALAAHSEDGMFVTLALTVINPRAGRLTVASAGHPLPLVRDAAGHVGTIGHIGDKPLGLDEHSDFAQYEYEIDPGDLVVFYTDGVIEALNRDNDLYGEERLMETIQRTAGGAELMVRTIADDVVGFADGHPQSDDVSVLCFDRK